MGRRARAGLKDGGRNIENRDATRNTHHPEVRNAMPTYEIVWEFTVPSAQRAAFEHAYGPAGPWADLFGRAEGHIETRLLRDLERHGIYTTIDRWSSKQAFMDFKRDFAVEYDRLDRELEGTSENERRIGVYATVSAFDQL